VVRITTKLVQVDAVVTDKNGKHVTDLKAEDFEVTENGKPRAITNFSFVTSAPVPSLPGENEQKAVPLTAKERATTPLAPMKQLRPDQVRPSVRLVSSS
jgi:VWFA-related protein